MKERELQLQDAILTGNLARVQEIIADRDERGVPRVNLNAGYDIDGLDGTALMLSITTNNNTVAFKTSAAIFQTLLDVRDNKNKLVIDVNKHFINGEAVIHHVLRSDSLSVDQARELLQRLLDLRPHGNLAVNLITPPKTPSLLEIALYRDDPDLLHMLLDVYDADGRPVLDINQEIGERTTLLCRANELYLHQPKKISRSVISAICDAGGLTWVGKKANEMEKRLDEIKKKLDWTDRLHTEFMAGNRRRLQHIENEILPYTGEMHNFSQNTQNTHETEVTVSVDTSIKKLKKKYPEVLSEEKAILEEIEAYLRNLPDSDKKPYVMASFERIKTNPDTSVLSGVTLSRALILVWKGIHDKKAVVNREEELTEIDIVERKNALVTNLYKIQTGRVTPDGLKPLCFVGSLNKLIETLDGIHPDVLIIMDKAAIKATAMNRILAIVNQEFAKKSTIEQKAILRTWNEDNGEATTFRSEMEILVKKEIAEEYQTLLTEREKTDLTCDFENTLPPPPIPHKALQVLTQQIAKIPDNMSEVTSKLKIAAKSIYADNQRTFEEEYLRLLAAFTTFKQDVVNSLPQAENQVSVISTKLENESSFEKTTILLQSTVQKINTVLSTMSSRDMQEFDTTEAAQTVVLHNLLEKIAIYLSNKSVETKKQLVLAAQTAATYFPETDEDTDKQILGGLLIALGVVLCATLIGAVGGVFALREGLRFFKSAQSIKGNLSDIVSQDPLQSFTPSV